MAGPRPMTALLAVVAAWALLLPLASCELPRWHKLRPERLREKPLSEGPFAKVKTTGRLKSDVPIVDPPTRTAGYFALDRTTGPAELFFFYFQARNNPSKAPLVLWMTGGPGCSSELAVIYENGPYTLDASGKGLVETPWGWDVTHNMIFVDQPVGTGYSWSKDAADDVSNSVGVAEDVLDFLFHFFEAHPELADLPFFVTGESYAGHYVPAVSHRVWLSNKNEEGPFINLRGIAIGNGITEPGAQMPAYADFALENKLISPALHAWVRLLSPPCQLGVRLCDLTGWDWVCALGSTYCSATQYAPIINANSDINVYDIRKKCVAPLCYDFSAADAFFNSPSVRAALGVTKPEPWSMCNFTVLGDFNGDQLRRFDKLLPDLLSDGIRVLIYAGDQDLICNWVGNRAWVDRLQWDGAEGWSEAQDHEWVVQGRAAGTVKHYGPLTFLRVSGAGHMVPMDQPLNALAMISVFTRNFSLAERWDVHAAVQQEEPFGSTARRGAGGAGLGSGWRSIIRRALRAA